MSVPDHVLHQLSLSRDEYARIIDLLDREPNELELGMFGALWSEHCGYKNSRPLLKLFPTRNARVLTEAGAENAGAVSIGDGLLVVFKIESHNHPSAIEPYQGAATGVGGIVRDIFAMGARPIALLDSLRFGPLSVEDGGDPANVARNRYLFGGVVGGIGGYGNTLGLPTVGGECYFEPAYAENPLVNAMCVGVAREGDLVSARAEGVGNTLMLVGADTGRDGIHGATFASVELDESSEERRPAVQVGNPFLEKLLIEACMELCERGRDWFVGLQDLGAAGLTSSAVECAARGGAGIIINVDRAPRRERGMTPYEVMLSESQERMLVVVKRGHEADVEALFQRWDLHCTPIGEVTDDGRVRIRDNGVEVANLPVTLLTDPPQYRREGIKPSWLEALQTRDLDALVDVEPSQATATLRRLLAAPNIASKLWIYRQYDHQVLTNTVLPPGGDAAVLRLRGTRRGIAVATDGNGRLSYLDPFAGGAIAVCEAARNVVCTGAEPVAVTNCLNFGNPEKPEIYFQLEQAIRGMAAACEALGTPVISGNVSLYNETLGEAVYPTPVIGMLGVLEDVTRRTSAAFQGEGDRVLLLGADTDAATATLGGSEYLRSVQGLVAGLPSIDLTREVAVQRACLEAIQAGLVRSAHDCADGGLAVALAECAIFGGIGVDASALRASGRLDALLFGEQQSRIVLSCRPDDVAAVQAIATRHGVPLTDLGSTGGDRIRIGAAVDLPLAEARTAHEGGIAAAMSA